MAWSGLGAGTIGDPYQITTITQYSIERADAAYNNTHYFKVMNNLDFTVPGGYLGGHIRSNVDGDNRILTVNLNTSVQLTQTHYLWSSNIYFKNIKYVFTDYSKAGYNFLIQNGALTGITIQNIEVEVLRFTSSAYFINFVSGDIPSGWTLDNIRIKGPFKTIFMNVDCSMTNVRTITTLNTITGPGFLCGNFGGALMEDCSVMCINANLNQGGLLAYNVWPLTTTVINRCYGTGSIYGESCAGLIYKGFGTNAVTISNCYFNGELIDLSNSLSIFSISAIVKQPLTNWTLTNNYAHIKSITKRIWSIRSSPYWFDDKGFSDWFVPSKDEMDVIKNYYNILPIQNMISYRPVGSAGWKGFITSSEVNATQYHRYSPTYGWQTNAAKATDEEMLIVARFYTYNVNDSPAIGVALANGCVVVWKDDNTLTALMINLVAEQAAIFLFGKSGTLIGTSTAWGQGANNTAMILAANPEIRAAVRYMDWDYPTIANISIYPINSLLTGTYNTNYCSILAKDAKIILLENANLDVVTGAELRTEATFVGWDFITIWEQVSAGVLPTLRSIPEEKFVGLKDYTKTGIQNMLVNLEINSDLLSAANVGLIVMNNSDSSILYDELGLSHVVNFPSAIDYNLVYKPFTVEGAVHTPNYEMSYVFYTYDQLLLLRINPLAAVTLNIATIGVNIKLVHGSLYLNGYVFGSSRDDGKIVKIDILNPSQNPATYAPLSGTYVNLDQIVYCNGFIWGQSGLDLCRLNPDTMAWDAVSIPTDGTSVYAQILGTSHDRYLYFTSVRNVRKLDTIYLTGATILTNCPGGVITNAIVSTYDSYTQGQYIGWSGLHPEWYLGDVKGACHSIIADSTHLYVAYTTQIDSTYVSPDGSGYSSVLETSVHELHKVKISDMTADGWVLIPKATDDMSQTADRLFLGCEVQAAALPITLGYGCSIYSVKKSNLVVTMLPKLHAEDNPPAVQSYASMVFGNYLIDCRTDGFFYIVDISDPDSWSLSTSVGKYTKERIQFLAPPTFTGIPNEILRGRDRKFYMFGWSQPGGTAQPSGYGELRIPSKFGLLQFIVQTVSAVII